MQLIQYDPASPIKFVPKEASPPRHLSDEEEDALVAAVNATGTLRDQTMVVLLLHTGLRAQELCTLTRQQIHLNKRNGTLRIIGKRRKVRDVPLNATARSKLNEYLATLSPECQYLFPSEKTQRPLTGRALGHLITKYARAAHVTDVSPHDLRHRFGYRMAEVVPLHRLAQIMGHDSLDTTLLYIRGTKQDLQQDVERIAWT
jgi:integrase/recombinase XerD